MAGRETISSATAESGFCSDEPKAVVLRGALIRFSGVTASRLVYHKQPAPIALASRNFRAVPLHFNGTAVGTGSVQPPVSS